MREAGRGREGRNIFGGGSLRFTLNPLGAAGRPAVFVFAVVRCAPMQDHLFLQMVAGTGCIYKRQLCRWRRL